MRGLVQIDNEVIEFKTDATANFIHSLDYKAEDNPDSPSVTSERSVIQSEVSYTHEPAEDF